MLFVMPRSQFTNHYRLIKSIQLQLQTNARTFQVPGFSNIKTKRDKCSAFTSIGQCLSGGIPCPDPLTKITPILDNSPFIGCKNPAALLHPLIPSYTLEKCNLKCLDYGCVWFDFSNGNCEIFNDKCIAEK